MPQAIRLSKSAIAEIDPPASGRDYYRDSECRGLVLMVTPSGSYTLQSYRKIAGRPVRVTLGTFDAAIPEARALPAHVKDGDSAAIYITTRPRLSVKKARALMSLLPSAAESPVELKRASAAAPTVATIIADYCRLHLAVNCRPGAVKRIEGPRKRVEDQFGSVKIIDLKRADVLRWHTEMVAQHKVHNANRALEVLRGAIGNAIEKGRLPEDFRNPAAGIKVPKEDSREAFVKADDMPLLMAELDNLAEHWRDLFLLLLLIGARRGAVQSMRWQHLDLKAGTWHMPKEASKNNQPQAVVLVPQAVEILRRRHAERGVGPFVFPSESVTGHIVSPKNAWADVIDGMHRRLLMDELKRANVPAIGEPSYKAVLKLASEAHIDCPRPDLRPHDLRRTLASWMASAGVSLQVIGKALGHRDTASTEIYARLQQDAVRTAQAAAADALLRAGREG